MKFIIHTSTGVVLLGLLVLFPTVIHAADFVALTSIPGIKEAGDSKNLATLFNNLYMICIGAASVLAVLKIVQGGITYMLGDSVTEKREAKHHIGMAILGLVLVLAPALVFGIIDPRILNLNVDVGTLAPEAPTPPAPGPATPVNGALSTGEEFADGSSVSCLYPGGGQGNKIGIVVSHVSSSVSGRLLSVRFENETTPRLVAPGDCHGYQANAADTGSLGQFAVGDTVYCKPFPPQYSKGTIASIDTTRGWLSVNFVSRESGRHYTENAAASTCLKLNTDAERQACGEAPNCNAGCVIASGVEDTCVVDSY